MWREKPTLKQANVKMLFQLVAFLQEQLKQKYKNPALIRLNTKIYPSKFSAF